MSEDSGKKKLNFPNMKKAELSKLAKDIATEKVFCSYFMSQHDQERLLGSIFMPLIFGALSKMPEEQMEDIGFFYEYYDRAGPMSVNGFPIFYSCRMVSRADAKRILDKVRKIRRILEDA